MLLLTKLTVKITLFLQTWCRQFTFVQNMVPKINKITCGVP